VRLYVTPGGQWAGTQAEARNACQDEGQPGAAWKEIDVPTDKAGLLEWLNQNAGPAAVEARRAESELDKIRERGAVAASHPPAKDWIGERHKHDVDVEQAIHAADLPRAIRLCEAAMNRVREHAAALDTEGKR
jgi:hypothetical protein